MKTADLWKAIENYKATQNKGVMSTISSRLFGYQPSLVLSHIEKFSYTLPSDADHDLTLQEQYQLGQILIGYSFNKEGQPGEESTLLAQLGVSLWNIDNSYSLQRFFNSLTILKQHNLLNQDCFTAIFKVWDVYSPFVSDVVNLLVSLKTAKLIKADTIHFVAGYITNNSLLNRYSNYATLVPDLLRLENAGVLNKDTMRVLNNEQIGAMPELIDLMLELNTAGILESSIASIINILQTSLGYYYSDRGYSAIYNLRAKIAAWLHLDDMLLLTAETQSFINRIDNAKLSAAIEALPILADAGILNEMTMTALERTQLHPLKDICNAFVRINQAGLLTKAHINTIILCHELNELVDLLLLLNKSGLLTRNITIKLKDISFPVDQLKRQVDRINEAGILNNATVNLVLSHNASSHIVDVLILLNDNNALTQDTMIDLKAFDGRLDWLARRIGRLIKADQLTQDNIDIAIKRADADTYINNLVRPVHKTGSTSTMTTASTPKVHSFIGNMSGRGQKRSNNNNLDSGVTNHACDMQAKKR